MTNKGFCENSVAAATATVGYDILEGTRLARPAKMKRKIKRVGLCGSAAAGDTIVLIEVGGESHGELYNTATGFPAGNTHMKECDIDVPSGAEINMYVVDPPATNPINPCLVIE